MTSLSSDAFRLNVYTSPLTAALKRLCKAEPRANVARLEHSSETLTLSIGRTSEDIPASGSWPQAVSVGRIWATTFANRRFEAAITPLRQADGWLYTRDNKMRCSLEPWTEESETSATRDDDVTAARQILGRYKITKREVDALIKAADPKKAWLWGPGDGSLVDEIASVWIRWAVHGLEASDIRCMFDQKSKELWKSGRKGGGLFARYNVSKDDERALIERGDSTKSQLCSRNARLLGPIAEAWKRLALYGVEPSDILLLMEGKSHCAVRGKTRGENP
jgi:hypothetical protein